MSKNRYEELLNQRQQAFNKIDFIWAFDDKQFERELSKRDITKDGLYRTTVQGMDLIYPKSETEKLKKWLDTAPDIKALMEEEPGFAFDAFKYEMFNHEYPINWQGDWDVCECFNFTGKELDYDDGKNGAAYLKELGYSDAVIREYRKAARYVRESQDW